MSRRLPYTPNSKIKNALRKLFLRSRERAARLKADGYCCQGCGIKQSRRKGHEVYVEVHHKAGVTNWLEIYRVIRKNLLCNPENLETLCDKCHKERHQGNTTGNKKKPSNP